MFLVSVWFYVWFAGRITRGTLEFSFQLQSELPDYASVESVQ